MKAKFKVVIDERQVRFGPAPSWNGNDPDFDDNINWGVVHRDSPEIFLNSLPYVDRRDAVHYAYVKRSETWPSRKRRNTAK